MKIVLDDTLIKASLYPFGLIKPVSFIRIGILSIKEKWEIITKAAVFDGMESFVAQAQHLNEKPDFVFPSNILPTKLYWQKAMLDKDLRVSTTNVRVEDIKTLQYPWQIFQFNDWALRQDYDVLTNGRASQTIPFSNKVVAPENIFIEIGIINASKI